MKTIAVYGSLKQYKYNHALIEGANRLGTSRMRGIMWLISSYPAFVPLEAKDDVDEQTYDHHFELYEVEDSVYERVRSMELGAGYDEAEHEFELREDGNVVKAIYYPASKSLREYCESNRPVVDHY